MRDRRIRVAKIGAAHGLRGELRLFVDADDQREIATLGALEDENGTRQFKIEALREGKDHLLVRFAGVNDRTAAERLVNLELYVPRDRLPDQTEQNSFYHADLVGLRAETRAGALLGAVAGVANYGAGDLLEIAPPDGGATFLVPFDDRFVPQVGVVEGRAVIELPEDFFASSPSFTIGERGGGTSKKLQRGKPALPPSRRARRADLPHKGGGEKNRS